MTAEIVKNQSDGNKVYCCESCRKHYRMSRVDEFCLLVQGVDCLQKFLPLSIKKKVFKLFCFESGGKR